MVEGRYLLGVESAERTATFLEKVAGCRFEVEVIRQGGRAAQALRRRRPFPTAAVLPCPEGYTDHLEAVRRRPVFQGIFGKERTSFGMVPLASLVPLQAHVDFSFALEAIPEEMDEAVRLDVCLPKHGQPMEARGGIEADRTFTLCTRDMNVSVAEVEMDTSAGVRVIFTLSRTAAFLVVVRRGHRLFLKDGTHRAVGLLARGVERAPAVVVDDGGDGPIIEDGLDEAWLSSSSPPFLSDFLDERLHVAHPWRRGLKVIRVRADEFVVPDEG